MWLTFAVLSLSAWIGASMRRRVGAFVVSLSIATLLHVAALIAPKFLVGSALARRAGQVVSDAVRDGYADNAAMLLAAFAGTGVGAILWGEGEARRRRAWDPDAPRKRRKGRARTEPAAVPSRIDQVIAGGPVMDASGPVVGAHRVIDGFPKA